MESVDHPPCPLCGRALVPGPSVNRHHLIPRLKGGQNGPCDDVHVICHSKIHSLWSERELARDYNTWEALRADPRIQTFVRWVRKKPATYVDSNRMARGHKKSRRRR